MEHQCYKKTWKAALSKKYLLTCYEYWQDNVQRTHSYQHENRAWKLLEPYYGWKRQFFFGRRIFDFFHLDKGIALEIDGSTHCKNCDAIRDGVIFKKYGVETIRLHNSFTKRDLDEVLDRYALHEVQSRKKRKRLDKYLRHLSTFLSSRLKIIAKKEKETGKEKQGKNVQQKSWGFQRKKKKNAKNVNCKLDLQEKIRQENQKIIERQRNSKVDMSKIMMNGKL